MKYKVLLTGKNNAAIDEFFTKMYNSFECQTTSICTLSIQMLLSTAYRTNRSMTLQRLYL